MFEGVMFFEVLTVLVIALCYILKRKFSMRMQNALCALVILQLLVPINFDGMNFGVLNVVEAAPRATFKVSEATNELLAKYESYDDFCDDKPEMCGRRIMFTTDRTLRNIKMFGIKLDSSYQIVLNRERKLYQQDELTPDKPLVGWLCFFSDTMPPAGIEFLDADGVIRSYCVQDSMKDGSIYMWETR